MLPNPDARTLREWTGAFHKIVRWPAIVVLALVVAILATAVTLPGEGAGDGVRLPAATARQAGPAGVAAAYGHPLRCLRIMILAAGERYASAVFSHTSQCRRFTGHSTAIFLRVMGSWRPVIEVAGTSERYSSPW